MPADPRLQLAALRPEPLGLLPDCRVRTQLIQMGGTETVDQLPHPSYRRLQICFDLGQDASGSLGVVVDQRAGQPGFQCQSRKSGAQFIMQATAQPTTFLLVSVQHWVRTSSS